MRKNEGEEETCPLSRLTSSPLWPHAMDGLEEKQVYVQQQRCY